MPSINHLYIARIAYKVNKAYCESLGDTSQVSWEDLTKQEKSNLVNGVDCHLKNPNVGAKSSHESWCEEKISQGWVVGEIRIPETKTHPNLVPFDQLPKEQQVKDYIFRAVVDALKNE